MTMDFGYTEGLKAIGVNMNRSEVMNDKTLWGHGPWLDEPDHEEFEMCGFPCVVHRSSRMGFLCGYVGVDKTHALYGKLYDEAYDEGLDGDVHGGLTYARAWAPGSEIKDLWWFGFDCGHLYDIAPGIRTDFVEPTSQYRTFRYVDRECRSLAAQLRDYGSKEDKQ